MKELLEAVRTPADTDARLKRELLSTVLQTPAEILREKPLFTVLLGANEKGRKLLSGIRKNKNLQIVTNRPEHGPRAICRSNMPCI